MKKYICMAIASLMLSGCTSSKLSMGNLDMEDAASMEDDYSMEEKGLSSVSEETNEEIQQEELVNDGSANYLYKQGVKFEEGKGIAVNLQKAESFYILAMEKGSVDAMNALGVLNMNKGAFDEAKKYFERAAEKNDEIANYNLGNMTFLTNTSDHNLKAIEYYKKAAAKNYAPAYVTLGDMYATGKGISHNVAKAEEYYLKAADLNDDVAIDRLALLYLLQDGIEVESDTTSNSIKTVKLFQRVADKGNPKAMYVLSLLYQNGFYVKPDTDKAVEYLKKSAELKYPEAEYSLAYLYLSGMYVEKDYKKGIQFMTKAANSGFPDAQNNIGMLYLKGELVTKNYNLARKWLEKASSNGSSMAAYNLAIIYDAGMGVPVDTQKAGSLYLSSANSGYIPAFIKVVDMYANGSKGVKKDNEKAREWLDKAIENEDSDAMLLKANAYFYGNYGYAQDMALAKKWLDNAKKLDNPNVSKVESSWKRTERYKKFQNVKR